MYDIYLLVEHGREQGEVSVLGWFDDERTAKDTALPANKYRTYLCLSVINRGPLFPALLMAVSTRGEKYLAPVHMGGIADAAL